jgi:hypothetical protein
MKSLSFQFRPSRTHFIVTKPPVGHRGRNNYKMQDGVRALRTARSGGMNPGMLEIETKDGTIFRVFDVHAASANNEARDASDVAGDRIAKMRMTGN